MFFIVLTFSVISSPISLSPLVNAFSKTPFLYHNSQDTPSYLIETLNLLTPYFSFTFSTHLIRPSSSYTFSMVNIGLGCSPLLKPSCMSEPTLIVGEFGNTKPLSASIF